MTNSYEAELLTKLCNRFVSLPSEVGKAKQFGFHHPSKTKALTEHYAYTDGYGCEECRHNITQVPRLIMVDQLWMWILDEQTIVTAFPQSWHKSGQEAIHDIHESIRARLRPLGMGQIGDTSKLRSIYELGLIILAECCTSLLGRRHLDASVYDG